VQSSLSAQQLPSQARFESQQAAPLSSQPLPQQTPWQHVSRWRHDDSQWSVCALHTSQPCALQRPFDGEQAPLLQTPHVPQSALVEHVTPERGRLVCADAAPGTRAATTAATDAARAFRAPRRVP
jgi:hypothetical protein